MKFVLLVYQGSTPLPGSDRWQALSEAEQKAIYADYAELNKTEGVAPGLPLGLPAAARTVQVRDGTTHVKNGTYLAEGAAGYAVFEADGIEAAIALAARWRSDRRRSTGNQFRGGPLKTSKKSAKKAVKGGAANAAKPRNAAPKSRSRKGAKPALLAGGNPQIAKADGDAPVQAYIAAMPGWKRDVGRRLDALMVRTVPGVRKAVKWNSPFYGVEGQGWFLNFHCFTNYVKVAFFRGTSLRPAPPGESKHKEVRYLDIREGDQLDEAQIATWIRQAAALPGWVP